MANNRNRQLVRKYHPDKNDCAATRLTMEEATEFFKLLNKVNDYLKKRAKVESAPRFELGLCVGTSLGNYVWKTLTRILVRPSCEDSSANPQKIS